MVIRPPPDKLIPLSTYERLFLWVLLEKHVHQSEEQERLKEKLVPELTEEPAEEEADDAERD